MLFDLGLAASRICEEIHFCWLDHIVYSGSPSRLRQLVSVLAIIFCGHHSLMLAP